MSTRMSTPRFLRTAIEACRPHKSLAIRSHPQFLPTTKRDFSSNLPRCLPEDITAGFPMPKIGVHKLDVDEAPETTETKSKRRQEAKAKIPDATKTKTVKEKTPSQEPAASSSSLSTSSPPPPPQDAEAKSVPASEGAPSASTQPAVPPNVLAAYRTPLRHKPKYGIPVAQLQLHSFSVRNLQFYSDFCVRAAYYLGLPCSGPAPLPRKRERWTVLRSNFVHKKSQENFERITMKRLITIYDGESSVVETWLAFIRKWQFYGVGLKANVWQWEELDVAGKMDKEFKSLEKDLDDKLRLFGFNKSAAHKTDLRNLMERQKHRQVGVPMSEIREKSRTTQDPF